MPSQLLCYRFLTYQCPQQVTVEVLDWLSQRGALTEGDVSAGWLWIWVPIHHEVVLLNLWGRYLERVIFRDL